MSNTILKWLILVAIVLLIVALLVFWLGGSSFNESGIQLTLTGPNQASVGDEVVYTLNYSNQTKTDLSSLRFVFTYPDSSVVLNDGSPSSDLTETLTLDSLPHGASGQKDFHAFLVGNKGDIKTAKVDLTYKAGDLKSEFTKEATLATTIISLPVSLTLVAPPNFVSGQTVNYILDYRNESQNDISNLQFRFTYPDGFSVQSTSPAGDAGSANKIWSVPLLKKGQGARISIQGPLTGKEGDNKTVSVLLKRKIGDSLINYEQASATSVITSPLLGVSMVVNDSKTYSATLGDTLHYVVQYSNNSNYNLSGMNLTVKLDGNMFDFSTLNVNGGYFDNSTNSILWNSSSVPDFTNLDPAKKGQVDFRIKLKPGFIGGSGSQNTFIKASARFSTPNVPPNVDSSEIFATSDLVTNITTQPSFTQTAYYNDSSFGISGPFPPQVGQETSFTVHWQLTNPGNDMTNVKVSATLPAGVNWKNVVSAAVGQAQPTFNKNTSQVVWNLGTLPQGVGTYLSKYEASFQVSIKPSANQKGSPVTFIKDVQFSGTDSYTKQLIVINGDDLMTSDLSDQQGTGNVQ